MAVLLAISFAATHSMKMIPSGLQNLMEYVVELLLTVCESTMGRRRGRRFFPVVATAFLFILTSNWIGLLPGFGDNSETPWMHEGPYLHPFRVTNAYSLLGDLGHVRRIEVPDGEEQ